MVKVYSTGKKPSSQDQKRAKKQAILKLKRRNILA
jgi:hypothetical protein